MNKSINSQKNYSQKTKKDEYYAKPRDVPVDTSVIKFQEMLDTFAKNAETQKLINRTHEDRFKPLEYRKVRDSDVKSKISKPNKRPEAVHKQLVKHTKSILKHKETGAPVHKFDFNAHPDDWANSIIGKEDNSLLNHLTGNTAPQDYIPQIMVVEQERPINLERLRTLAATDAVLAFTKGILLNEKVDTSAGPVGIHYLAMVTVYYDMLLALNGEITIFSEVTPFYNMARSYLMPKVIGAYSFTWTNVPEITKVLAQGVPFEIDEPGPNTCSLAWLTGNYNSHGQATLVNTLPVLQVEDLTEFGVDAVIRLWRAVLQSSTSKVELITPYIHKRAYNSPAAFSTTRDTGVESYNGFAVASSPAPIYGPDLFMASTMLVDVDDPAMEQVRGRYSYTVYAGSLVFNWRTLYQDTSTRVFNPCPRQIPLSSYYLQILSMIFQADMVANNLSSKGQLIQPSDSLVGQLNAGDFIMAVTSFVLKRYSMSNYLMFGTDSINKDVYKLGVGSRFLIDYGSVLNSFLPMLVTEGMASLNTKCIKTGKGYKNGGEFDLIVPTIIMTGEKMNSDPLLNGPNMQPLSIINLITTMYPDVTLGSQYDLAKYNPLWTFDISDPFVSVLYGPQINKAIANFNEFMGKLQGYFDIGLPLANLHDEPYTLADYAYLCKPYLAGTGWDTSANVAITAMSSTCPFDPDKVSDQLTRILPVVFGDDFQVFVNMTGETISLTFDSLYSLMITTNAVGAVHPIAGWGNETSISDHAVTARHEGGGVIDFFKSAGKIAIPVLGSLMSNVANSYIPGSGGVVKGLGDFLTERLANDPRPSKGYVKVMSRGHEDRYNKAFRPCTNGKSSNSMIASQIVTREYEYW